MTAEIVEIAIGLLQLLAIPAQSRGRAGTGWITPPPVRWSPRLIAGNAVGGLGLLCLVGYWAMLGTASDPAIPLLGLLLGGGCLGLAAWMADETDLAGPPPAPKRPKKGRDPARDEL